MAETKREVTVEEVLAAAKEGTDSAAWASLASGNIIMAAGAKALKKAIESGEQVLEYKKPQPDTYDTNINTIKDKANYIPRGEHQAWFNKNGSVALKEDGTVSMASSTVNHLELTPGGGTYITNVETEIKTNSFSLQSEDVIVNNHKLNNKLYELADFKRVLNTYDGTPCIAGGLTMLGTVLVKTWEPNLQRYVLVRRQINLPVFSPEIGGVDVHPGLNITPDTEFILNFRKMLNKTGISSYEDLLSTMEMNRAAAVAAQEQATAAKNEEIKKANEAKQAVSMTTLTGQNAGSAGGSIATGTVPVNQGVTQNQMIPTTKPSVAGWDTANNRPNDPEAYWYKVECRTHKFYVMKGHTAVESWPCNYSSFGSTANKIKGDNKTPIGVFQISTPENIPNWELSSGCKIINKPGVFGPWYTEINLGGSLGTSCGIAIHGDYPSENNSNILLSDAPAGKDAVPGQGSTHGCIRLLNENDTTFATKYAKAGQYIKIEA